MVLETSWGTGAGWMIVRDVLLMGPLAPRARALAGPIGGPRPTTTPSTSCCGRCGASTGRSRWRSTASRRSTTVASASVGVHRRRVPPGQVVACEGGELQLTLTSDLRLGIEGPRATARHRMKEGEQRFCALSWATTSRRRDVRGRLQASGVDSAPLAALAGRGTVPRPSVAPVPPAQRADAEGPDLRADGRADRRRHHVAAGNARRRAQLGLPLQLDPGLDLHAVGLYTLGFDWEANDFFYFIADVADTRRRPPGHVRRRRRA